MVELVDTLGLGPSAFGCRGSSPLAGTKLSLMFGTLSVPPYNFLGGVMQINKKQKALKAALIFGAFFVFPILTNAATSDIVFTEIMYNPSSSDTKKEWVEIYNNGSDAVTIIEGSGTDSWRFNDGSNHTLSLIQGSLAIPSGGYVILASDAQTFLDEHAGYTGIVIDTVMSLNNTTDTIKLSSDKGATFFSDVTYDDTQGADGDGNSLQFSSNVWVAETETPGTAASGQTQESSESTPAESTSSSSGSGSSSGSSSSTTDTSSDTTIESEVITGDPTKVRITEIFPNPIGDEQQEFVELWNNNDESISLDGWKLADASKIKTLSNITLVPGEYYPIYRSSSGIALNNSSETIFLYSPNGDLINTHEYQSTIEGYSLSYDINKEVFLWSSTKTPAKQNQITTPNDPPIPAITFSNNPVAPNEKITISSHDSTDADDDALSYFWTIGKSFQASGPKLSYAFSALGSYTIHLTTSDAYHDVIATSMIDVIPANDILSLRSQRRTDASHASLPTTASDAPGTDAIPGVSPAYLASGQIYITEIFPNPAGRDDDEWIELYNLNEFAIVLDNWIIDDQDGGSRPHTIADRTITANSYLILGKEEIKITLNNSSDEVRLFDAEETLIDEVLYDDVQENQSYTKSDDGFWFWTESTTPGEPNTIDEATNYNGFVDTNPQLVLRSFSEGGLTDIIDIDLPDIRELELGTEVKVQGTVAVEPGVLGKTYFYITGSPGIQVYFYKKDWPSLAIGDVIGVIGELTESNNELRLKIASKNDIVPLYESDPPIPTDEQTGTVNESMEGALVKLTAELVEKKGTSWYVDDGTGEVKITFQPATNITKPKAKAGDWLEVVGLVSETRSGYRVLPRYQEDIRLINMDELVDEETGKVLGAQVAGDDIQRFRIPANNTSNKILVYLLIISTALIILLAGLLIKFRIESQKRIKEFKKN